MCLYQLLQPPGTILDLATPLKGSIDAYATDISAMIKMPTNPCRVIIPATQSRGNARSVAQNSERRRNRNRESHDR
jgi:hypothetical protein